ncbi:MAG: hypothetical protein ABSD74_12690 [Rhizomicrobium sp.]|jgi:hypothetical protein
MSTVVPQCLKALIKSAFFDTFDVLECLDRDKVPKNDDFSGQHDGPSARKRGAGRGGNFFVLDREVWAALWHARTKNRLNLVTAYLVLLAGTGADHRLTKWSAKACEDRAGMGKPRAKVAIDELIEAGFARRTVASRPMFPQYELAAPSSSKEPIFLPIQLVTGLAGETPMLRRIRENGDVELLRMLIDLYGLIQVDSPYGVPLENLRLYDTTANAARKVCEMGANALWAVRLGNTRSAGGDWAAPHIERKSSQSTDWTKFWSRLDLLERIGALWFEPWIFDGDGTDAEPLYPIEQNDGDDRSTAEVMKLNRLSMEAAFAFTADRSYLIDQNADCNFVVVPAHHRAPTLRGVGKLRVEADTPGRRLAYAKRMGAIESYTASLEEVIRDAGIGVYNRPVRLR